MARVELFLNQDTDGLSSVESFAGGEFTVFVDPVNVVGSEMISIGFKPTGSSGGYKYVGIPAGDWGELKNFKVIGATDIVGKLQGADPGGATDITLEMNS